MTMPQFSFFWTDVFLWGATLSAGLYGWHVRRSSVLRATWSRVWASPAACSAGVFLLFFVGVALLDSIHYRPALPKLNDDPQAVQRYSPIARSVLDELLERSGVQKNERSYSAPLALHLFHKESIQQGDTVVRDFPPLLQGAKGITTSQERRAELRVQLSVGVLVALLWLAKFASLLTWQVHRRAQEPLKWHQAVRLWLGRESRYPSLRAVWLSVGVLVLLLSCWVAMSQNYYVLGTDRSGNDVVIQALKSVRTAMVIGTLTTVAMLPPAIIFGVAAGYFKGWVDDLIQYLYTTLTSIPGVLLIAACVLMMQVYIEAHPELFDTIAARADLRLFMLCLILGLTGWSGLCRLLRAETLKLRELDYVQAAKAFGVGHMGIMVRHIFPNLLHIVLITMVLEFSGLVLYEAILSYLGIGVDPSMPSFGTMIDASRLEMSRDPMIWWNLLAAFAFLLVLVLSANIFADAVQQAFDPRAQRFSTRWLRRLSRTSTKAMP